MGRRIVIPLVVGAAAALVTWAVLRAPTENTIPDVLRLEHPSRKVRITVLKQLLAANDINNLPTEFSFTRKSDRIEHTAACDANGDTFHVVEVTYEVDGGRGARSYTFVFDKRGRYLLGLRSMWTFAHGAMVDFDGDGLLEVVMTEDLSEKFTESRAQEWGFETSLKVWRLRSPQADLLLDVRFTEFAPENGDPNEHTEAVVVRPKSGEPVQIKLAGRGFKPRITFSWSKKKHRFSWDGPRHSEYWSVLYPRGD